MVHTPADDALFCPQIMSVLLFIEHSVEVAHGKASCKFSRKGYLRIGRSRKGEWGRRGEGPWLGVDRLGFEALPLALFEPQIFHLQMELFHLSPPGSPGVAGDRMVLCKPNQLRKMTAGLSCLRSQWLPITL